MPQPQILGIMNIIAAIIGGRHIYTISYIQYKSICQIAVVKNTADSIKSVAKLLNSE